MPWSYRLFEALRRLGVKHAQQPALVEGAVLQAMVVGDVSHLASPVLPPLAWFGGYVAGGGIAQYSGVQVVPICPGGCYVSQLHVSSRALSVFAWSVDQADPLAASPLANTWAAFDMGPAPVSTIVRYGDTTVVPAATIPRLYRNTNQTYGIGDGFYVPPGSILTFLLGVDNTALDIALLVQDCPESAPPD